MYDERREKFSIRDVILQILFVVIFILILIWLFPMKGDITKGVKPLYETRFNENVNTMKEAAQNYFTTSRLPKKVGDKVTLTLSEMLEKKIILPFLDSNNNQCDLGKSYVEITKMDDEYVLKVNLSCTDKTDYVLVYMGCYDYCDTDICEKEEEKKPDPKTPTSNKPTTPNKPTPPTNPKTTYYEYKKDGYWKDWSNWSTTKVTSNSSRQVETKVTESTKSEQVLKGYNVKVEKTPIYKYVDKYVRTETLLTCEKYGVVSSTANTTYSAHWVKTGTVTLTYAPDPTDTVFYKYVEGSRVDSDCGNCSSSSTAKYDVYKKTTYVTSSSVKYGCVKYGEETQKIYATVKQFTGKYDEKETKTPVYETKNIVVKTTYYRYRDYISSDTKWSKYNDTSLLNNGYKYTGKKDTK